MAFLIGGANSEADTGFDVANSCRWNDDDSPYMHKTPGGAGNRRTWTVSVWVKKTLVGGSVRKSIFGTADTEVNGNGGCLLRFENGDSLKFESDGGVATVVATNAVYVDPSAWMHVVLAVDTTQGTAANRVKIYINGVQETSLASTTYPDQNKDYHWNNTVVNYVGAYDDSGDIVNSFDGYMAEFVSIDGSALSPTSFGEFDEDSPTIWKPIDVSGLTFGTNGFYLDFEASGNLGNDANGGTDLTEVNLAATDQSSDSPTNNFAIGNFLIKRATVTVAEGNLKITQDRDDANAWGGLASTLGAASGKWYAEFAIRAGDTHSMICGAVGAATISDNVAIGFGTPGGAYLQNGSKYIDGTGSSGFAGTAGLNDIIGCAMDLDNHKVYFSNGGEWANGSGAWDSTTFDAAVGAISLSQTSGFYLFGHSSDDSTTVANYGNPITANTSDAADENGYGAFEYAPPSGYLSLCTKNLGSSGG